jgi:hypothetical protein
MIQEKFILLVMNRNEVIEQPPLPHESFRVVKKKSNPDGADMSIQ